MAFSPFSHPVQLEGGSFAPDVVVFDDFFETTYVAGGNISATDNQGQWFVTRTNEGTIVPSIGEIGGVMHITTDTADEDGNEVETKEDVYYPASIDYSKLVPLLVQEIKSLRQRVATLEG